MTYEERHSKSHQNALQTARVATLAAATLAAGCAARVLDEAPNAEETATASSELRRWDLGLERSLRVLDPRSGWQIAPVIPWTRPITYSTLTGPLHDRGVASMTQLQWVGDSSSYIDVFDNPLGFNFTILPPTTTFV